MLRLHGPSEDAQESRSTPGEMPEQGAESLRQAGAGVVTMASAANDTGSAIAVGRRVPSSGTSLQGPCRQGAAAFRLSLRRRPYASACSACAACLGRASGRLGPSPADPWQEFAREAVPVIVKAMHVVVTSAAGLIGGLRLKARSKMAAVVSVA